MKRVVHCLSCLLLGLFFTANSHAQNAASAIWPLTNPTAGGTGQGVVVSGQIVSYDLFLKNMEIPNYTGTNNSMRVRMAGMSNSWPANQTNQIDTVYMQFKVSVKSGYTLRIDSLVLRLGASSTSTMKANLYYSKDSTFTSKTLISYITTSTTSPAGTFLSSTALDGIRVSPTMLLKEGESFYFRIYPWVDGQASPPTGKYACPQNVGIYGTASAIPIPASATWPLYSSQSPTVSGLLSAANGTYGGGLYHYDYTTNGDRLTIPNGGPWPYETAPNFSRYVQYKVAPLTGGTFVSDSLFFTVAAEFTNFMKAAFYVSKDSTGAVRKSIIDIPVVSTRSSYAFQVKDTIESGSALYLRVYPYSTNPAGDPPWKLLTISDVRISGSTTGAAISPPTVSTIAATYISTLFFTSGGNITADGGGAVTVRGVCWNTAGSPTISDRRTIDGTGAGSFISSVTGLSPGTAYRLRAYATNVAGTSYGSEITISTLTAIVVPTVSTTPVSTIVVKTATSGGSVTEWGGAAVTERGICWNTRSGPTTSDSKTIEGSGLGSFTSALTGLTAGTAYFVRAYAVNSAGTSYGAEYSFTTKLPQSDTTVIVAKDGSGQYTTLQAAFRAVPMNYTGRWTIVVKKGTYYEKDTLTTGKVNVVLLGEHRDSTIITYDDYGDKYGSGNPGTNGSFTIAIDASDFIAKNITLRNTFSPQPGVSGSQAVALRTNGDRQEFINCNILGYQDTYYTWGGSGAGRSYHKNCLIAGTVDFVFGRSIAVFDSCIILVRRNGGTITAASTDASSLYGYVFRNCTLQSDSMGYDGNLITSFYLGRPWQAAPRTVFLNCYQPSTLHPAGWQAWNSTPGLYAEFRNLGPGAVTAGRVSWSSQLTPAEAATYSLTTIFRKSSAVSNLILFDWMPVNAVAGDNLPLVTGVEEEPGTGELPQELSLGSFPNPFNPECSIEFVVPNNGRVTLNVYNLLGQEVAMLFDGEAETGRIYRVRFAGSLQPSGVYIARIQSGSSSRSAKLVLMK